MRVVVLIYDGQDIPGNNEADFRRRLFIPFPERRVV